MMPVYQTKHGSTDGNCFVACVASLLDKKIEDVDVDMESCNNSFEKLKASIQQRAGCKIYNVSYEAITNAIVKTSQRYCMASVCSFMFDRNPHHPQSVWHVVVCQIENDGKISIVFNPDKDDTRKDSLQQFSAIDQLFFVINA